MGLPLHERFYELVANDDDARVCASLPDEACHQVPGNFVLVLASLVLTKLGDLLISPKIVLAWLLGAVGAPAALIGVLVPIREAGSMLPQLLIGAWVRQRRRRKGYWVLGSALQGACVALMAWWVWRHEGVVAGVGVVLALVLFSLARGLCSVAMKDVQGKTIPRARRGRLTGLAGTLAGVMTALLSLWLFREGGEPSRLFYIGLLVVAALLWWNAAMLFARVEELPGETEGGRNGWRQAWSNLGLLRDDRALRRFVVTRALLMSSALAAPFMVMLLQGGGGEADKLGALLLSSALASSLSATIWGYLADRSSRRVMLRGGGIAVLACVGAVVLAVWAPTLTTNAWSIPLLYFVLGIGHAGVRIGRKTYLVDMAEGDRRTDYVSVSNSAIGVLLLLAGAACAGLASISVVLTLAVLAAMGLAGVWCAWRLPEVE